MFVNTFCSSILWHKLSPPQRPLSFAQHKGVHLLNGTSLGTVKHTIAGLIALGISHNLSLPTD